MTPDDFKQRLRLRRFMLASIFSALYLVVLVLFYTQDKIDRVTLFQACVIVASVIFAFFIVFRLGINLRFPDPSLTVFQLLAAVFTMLFGVYRAPDSRLAFTAFFFVALMFGMLRCSGTKLAVLGSVSLAAFGLVVWRRYSDNHDADMLRLDMLQFVVIAVTFPWFLFIGGRVKQLQRDLREVNTKLEDIEEQARRDDLTGVYNRRALLVAMEEARQRANITGEPLSICVIDLDFFKRYNDEFDHLTGDPGAILDAERLRNQISTLDIPFARSRGPLTVSVGVAQYRPGETIVQTFARADGALYKAKQLGRNRVEC